MSTKRGVQYSVTRPEEGKKVLYNGAPTNGITKATLYDTTYDVVDIIDRARVPLMVADTSRYELMQQYSATTSCLANDEYDEEKGKDMAKRKVLRRYNSDKIAKIDLAIADLQAVIERLERQKKIATERVARDEAYLAEEHAGKAE
jgi:uncharacterized protein (DUF2344 family)